MAFSRDCKVIPLGSGGSCGLRSAAEIPRSQPEDSKMRRVLATLLTGVLLNPAMVVASPPPGNPGSGNEGKTATPIKHLVGIFNENISFDHYFGTYPHATNPAGEPQFHAAPGTPNVNGLNKALLTRNPNLVNSSVNGTGATIPFRLDRSEAATADQDHDYTPEQQAF